MSKILLVALLGLALVAAQPTRFSAFLNGAQNSQSAVTSIGSGWVELMPGNMLMAAIAWDSSLTGVSAAHIHGPAMPGSAAGVIIGLEVNAAGTMANVTAALPGSWNMTAFTSGMYYFNVHTSTYPNGAIRGQIFAATNWWASALNGNNIVPMPSTPSMAMGKGGCTLAASGSLSCMINYYNLADATVAHVHGPAFPNGNAGVLITLTKDGSTFSGNGMLTMDQTMMLALGQFYLVVHSTAMPNGAIRGPLYISTVDPMFLNGILTAPCYMDMGSSPASYTKGCIDFSNGNGAYMSESFSDSTCTTKTYSAMFGNLLFAPMMQNAIRGGWDATMSGPQVSGVFTYYGAAATTGVNGIKAACPSGVVDGNTITVSQATCPTFFEGSYGNVMVNPAMNSIALSSFSNSMSTGLASFAVESVFTKDASIATCAAYFSNTASSATPVVALIVALIAAVRLF